MCVCVRVCVFALHKEGTQGLRRLQRVLGVGEGEREGGREVGVKETDIERARKKKERERKKGVQIDRKKR